MEDTRHTLFTGATGLLGQRLLWDLLRARQPIAVLARPQRGASAAERLERQLTRMEQRAGRTVPRPVILTGSLTKADLGISAGERTWLKKHCRGVLHCAASVSFKPAASDPHQEPFATNLGGTRRLAELAIELGFSEFHHVSSAYVCGMRRGRVMETEVVTGQQFSNDYETSKCAAESDLQELAGKFQLTVYRPSIIVPDSGTEAAAATNQTLGLAFHTLRQFARRQGLPELSNLLQRLSLTGEERKNLVPASWVAQLIVQILQRKELHGETYHLTHSRGVSIRSLIEVFIQILSQEIGRHSAPLEMDDPGSDFGMLGLFMQSLAAYLRDDPEFDRTCLQKALQVCGSVPCPDVEALLPEIFAGFDSRQVQQPAQQTSPQEQEAWPRLQQSLRRPGSVRVSSLAEKSFSSIGLVLTGPTGGSWQFTWVPGGTLELEPASPSSLMPMMYSSTSVWEQLLHQSTTLEEVLQAGKLVLFFPLDSQSEATALETVQELLTLLAGVVGEPATEPISAGMGLEVQHGA